MEEVWKKIPGFGDWYEASNLGGIRSRRYNKVKALRPHKNKQGYSKAILFTGEGRWGGVKGAGKCVSVHRAVWEAFYGPIPAGMEVDHIDHDPTNNRLANLQLLTPRENKLKAWDSIRSQCRTWPRRRVSA